MAAPKLFTRLENGRLTIPDELREALGLGDDELVSITVEDGGLQIRSEAHAGEQGSPWLRAMYELFAPVRESLKDVPPEEIDAAIDQALRESRAARR